MNDRLDAELDEYLRKTEREQQARKASILGSPVEMDRIIYQTERELRLKIMKLLLNLTDAGLELGNPNCHRDLPEQTKEMVIELSEHVEEAIEEYINE